MPHADHSPGRLDLSAEKGMDWSWTFTFKQNGAAYVLTSGTITAVVKTAADSSGTLVQALTGTVTSGAGGIFTVTLTDTLSGALTAGRYWWSCYHTTSTGTLVPLMAGVFTITDEVAA